MVTITIDTNVIIQGIDGALQQRTNFAELVMLQQTNQLSVAVSNRIIQDKVNDKDPNKVKLHQDTAKRFEEISSPFRINLAQDHGILPGKGIISGLEILLNVDYKNKRRNSIWDVDHLFGHYVAKRDFFLTEDEGIYNKRVFLLRFGVNVGRFANFMEAWREMSKEIDNGAKLAYISAKLDAYHRGGHIRSYSNKMNKQIDLALEEHAKEVAEEEYRQQAKDPTTPVGKAVYGIASLYEENGFLQGEGALFFAEKEYPKLLKTYQTFMQSKYGDNLEGLLKWLREGMMPMPWPRLESGSDGEV